MINCYFTNLEKITICELKKAQRSIKAAVAWINFNIYGEAFCELIKRGVKIQILLNYDGNNHKYMDHIHSLNNLGADIRLVRFGGIMHHKFCVIDNCICMFGSFNWTYSANVRNIEDINICNDVQCVSTYLLEFESLWKLTPSDIRLLRNPQICCKCKSPIVNILFMEPEGKYQTKIDVLQQCGCNQKIVFTDYFDAGVYKNYQAVINQFKNAISYALQSNNESLYHQIVAKQDFEIANYLSMVRSNRMGLPIIHAVGVKTWKWLDKHNGEYVYEIIWKERGTDSYIDNEYDIQ